MNLYRRIKRIGHHEDASWRERPHWRESHSWSEDDRYSRADDERGRASIRDDRDFEEEREGSDHGRRYAEGVERGWRDDERDSGPRGRSGTGWRYQWSSSTLGLRRPSPGSSYPSFEHQERLERERSRHAAHERPIPRSSGRRHRVSFNGVTNAGSNLGFSGGTASLGFGEDALEASGISGALGIHSVPRRAPQHETQAAVRRGQHAGKGPKDFRRSDERLREEISARLRADPDIDASEITLEVKDGEVTLEGSVPDRQTKRDAVDCAENVLGVCQVNNRLRVTS
jgi:osmotically-inducible protein OsmY